MKLPEKQTGYFDWAFALFIFVVVLVFAVLCALMLMGEGDFMKECQQDHKKYECTAMWRSGDRGTTSVMVVPAGR